MDGNLVNLILKKSIPDSVKIHIIYQIVKGLDYLHKRRIIHRDLKLENILYKRLSDQSYEIKIIDFGIARSGNGKTFLGTEVTMAPEIILKEKEEEYSSAADIWSLGVCIWKFFTNEFLIPPNCSGFSKIHNFMSEAKSAKKVLCKFHPKIPASILPIAQKCTVWNPEERITAKEIIKKLSEILNL